MELIYWKHKEWLNRQNYAILSKRDNHTPLEFGVKNCYTWAKEQITSHGGRLALAWSENWFGHFHIIYVKQDGSLWGYDPDDKSYVSLFRFIIDREWTFSGHTMEYETYTSFMDGLRASLLVNPWIRYLPLLSLCLYAVYIYGHPT